MSGNGRAPHTTPIPAFPPPPASAAEYNGKFMVGQIVLRGGSLATPPGHYPPHLPELLPARRPLAILRLTPGQESRMSTALNRLPRLADTDFAVDMYRALATSPHLMPPKYFYDAAGSALFDRICDLPEYYPTRTELEILHNHSTEIAAAIGADAEIIEFGAGSLTKIRLLLNALQTPRRYLPLDISGDHLQAAATRLAQDYPTLPITPPHRRLRRTLHPARRHRPPHRLLPRLHPRQFHPGRRPAIPQTRRQATRRRGPTHRRRPVQRPRNPARRLQRYRRHHRRLQPQPAATRQYRTQYKFRPHQLRPTTPTTTPPNNASKCTSSPANRKTITYANRHFTLAEGETIHTENSYKFTIPGFHSLARQAGFHPKTTWTDPQNQFSVHWLEA